MHVSSSIVDHLLHYTGGSGHRESNIVRVIVGSPEEVWNGRWDATSIGKSFFDGYYDGRDKAIV